MLWESAQYKETCIKHLFRYIYIIHNCSDISDRLFWPLGCNVLLKMTLKNRMEKTRFPLTPPAQKLKKTKSFKFSFYITRWHCSVSESNCRNCPKLPNSTTHSSVLAWRIPGTAESDGLPSMGWHRVGHDWSNLAAAQQLSPRSKVENRLFNWLQISKLAKSNSEKQWF